MKLSKGAKIGLFSIPILLGIYLIYKQFRKPSDKPYTPPPTPKPPVVPIRTPTQTNSGCDYPLKKGTYNCDLVKQVQWALNHIPSTSYWTTSNLVKYRPLVEDGDFGPKTQAVLNDFWGEQCGGLDCTIETPEEMEQILMFVVTDPIEFQKAENPYVTAPAPPSNSTPTLPSLTTFP
jgi:hypothetical protein